VDPHDFQQRLGVALGIIARFAVRHDLAEDEIHQVVKYLALLFPCGAVAPPEVERADGSKEPVPCGQIHLFHKGLHRSTALVRTVDAGWLQHLSEWLQGGITHAWPGEFCCLDSLKEASDQALLAASVLEQVEEYKVEKCLEGVSPKVGTPWVLKAHGSLSGSSLKVMQDSTRLCVVCTEAGSDGASFWKLWTSSAADFLPVCGHCYSIMESNGLCKGTTVAPVASAANIREGRRCEACSEKHGKVIVTEGQDVPENAKADHRLQPCRCLVCRKCAEHVAWKERSVCPICSMRVQWLADERALIATGWRVTRPTANRPDKCGICVSRTK